MKKEHLIESQLLDAEILEESKSGVLKVKVKFQHAGIVNNNNRRYGKEIMQREINKIQDAIKEGKVYGAAYHPKSGEAEVPDVAMIWKEAKMEKDGSCVGVADILPTLYGSNAITILKAGGKLGLSSRGYGTTTRRTEDGKTFQDVNDDFQLKTPGDIVLSPSVADAQIQKIVESQANNFDNEEKEELTEEQKERELNRRYNEATESGYIGTFSDWKKLMKGYKPKTIAEEQLEELEEFTKERRLPYEINPAKQKD